MTTKGSEIVEIFNKRFATITGSLELPINDSIYLPTEDILDPVDKAIMQI